MPIGIRVTELPAATGTLDDDDEFLSLEDGSLRRATRTQAGPKAAIVQVADTANQFTGTNVETVLAEIQDNVDALVIPHVDARRYGLATANTAAANDAAFAAAVAAMPAGGTLFIPAGDYDISSPIDFGTTPGIKMYGAGRPGDAPAVSNNATTLHYSGTGGAIRWAIGAGSSLFSGITISDLAIVNDGATSSPCGIHLGNASNCIIERVLVADFTTSAGILITGSTGSQYNTINDCTIADCLYAIDMDDTNGLRIIGGLLEGNAVTPVAGSRGIRTGTLTDSLTVIGAVIQGFDVLIDTVGTNPSFVAVRCEGFTTAAYNIGSDFASVYGGSIANSISGGGGTGVVLTAASSYCTVDIPYVLSTTTVYSDAGASNSVNIKNGGRVAIPGLRVQKIGTGAQNPLLEMLSNTLVGPTITTTSSFTRMSIDHAYASAAGIDLKVRGSTAISVDHTGAALELGFFGTAPALKPTVTGSRGGNAALASLLSALAALGLVTDSSSA